MVRGVPLPGARRPERSAHSYCASTAALVTIVPVHVALLSAAVAIYGEFVLVPTIKYVSSCVPLHVRSIGCWSDDS